MNIFRRVKAVNLVAVVSDEPESDVPCGECTLCCELLSPHLTPEEISSGKYPVSFGESPDGPVVLMFKKPGTNGCSMFIDGKCSIYNDRPLACRQYDCRKGHHQSTDHVALEKFGVKVGDEARQNSSIYYSQE
jgi:Fe-S-cluster containining protein